MTALLLTTSIVFVNEFWCKLTAKPHSTLIDEKESVLAQARHILFENSNASQR